MGTETNYKYVFTYDPDGGGARLHDGEVEIYVEMLVKSCLAVEKVDVVISNELVVQYIRVAVMEGKLPWEQTAFKFNDLILPLTISGGVRNWPHGFCDTNINAIQRLAKFRRKSYV